MTDRLLWVAHQLLQRCQLLWEVAQSRPVELQPSQAAHTLDMLREVAALCVCRQERLHVREEERHYVLVWRWHTWGYLSVSQSVSHISSLCCHTKEIVNVFIYLNLNGNQRKIIGSIYNPLHYTNPCNWKLTFSFWTLLKVITKYGVPNLASIGSTLNHYKLNTFVLHEYVNVRTKNLRTYRRKREEENIKYIVHRL